MHQDKRNSFHSPLLSTCPATLPAEAYFEPQWFERDQREIWARNWIYAGRDNDLAAGTIRRISVAGQNLMMVKSRDGEITCFHNTCRHRGAELCNVDERKLGAPVILCPYHAWSYDLTGKLLQVGYATPGDDFRKEDHGLFPVHVMVHDSFVYVCLADHAPPFERIADGGPDALKNWPMRDLVTGHTLVKTIACNWKIFWENYNECLHCPGIHPSLCDMVPVYSKGIMSEKEAGDWTADKPMSASNLKEGATTWTVNGKPCGPEFPDLDDQQRSAGHLFVTMLPTMYVVAHIDYVRVVSMRPLTPETTELTTQWLFPSQTLASKEFDLRNIVNFATTVMMEDAQACEINQRGLRSPHYKAGTLMPQEFDVFNFQEWVRKQLNG